MNKIIFITLLITTSAWANLHLAPPDFNYQEMRATFVDFKKAHYEITYDVRKKLTTVKSRIEFDSRSLGSPLFDLIPDAKNVYLDGMPVSVVEISAPNDSKLRMVNAVISDGHHVLEMENTIRENVKYLWWKRGVHSAFWIRDLKDRKFLEQYVPSNFEFDQYQMTFVIKFEGNDRVNQDIFTNGEVKEIEKNVYQIDFPSYFTVSCPYFHTTPKGRMRRFDYTYKSISGREIPMTVYSPWYLKTSSFKRYSLQVMEELEADYGAWAHPRFLAYGTLPGTGGMEHSGATATSLGALDHEMLHSYFAKGVMPANGNSGWIDEAIASWRDYGYQRLVYNRQTDSRSYALGREFMGYLDYRLQDVGGLKAFLKAYFAAYKHQVITTEHFKNNLEFFSGLDLTSDFNTYIWGEDRAEDKRSLGVSHHHKALTKKQLLKLL
jgi:hypothetical protein